MEWQDVHYFNEMTYKATTHRAGVRRKQESKTFSDISAVSGETVSLKNQKEFQVQLLAFAKLSDEVQRFKNLPMITELVAKVGKEV